jgi:hypothetical protein
MSDLMQKLAMSKKIMEVQDRIPRGQVNGQLPMNENVNYNIPQDMVQQPVPQQMPTQKVQQPQPVTEDRISNSKLPDEIKRLMLEHPIEQPNFGAGSPVLSDEIIEGAARLMGRNQTTNESVKNNVQTPSINNIDTDLKQMIRDVVRDTVRDVVREELQNAGMITESENKTNEILSLRVGKHIFEGKVLKIKKLKQ